ncbi:MAG: hypothetical protein KAJ39_07920 [Gammaproteobacteria bacterium]|nr:hypothetical protein [Gammaproteobacteria bacterium]
MKKIIISIFTLVSMLMIFQPLVSFGIGQVTEPIIIKDILRDSEVSDALILFNSEDKEVILQLKAEGEIADWASFYEIDDKNLENPITEIQVPAKSRLDVTVKFKIPEDASNGEYVGEIAIMTAPAENEEMSKTAINVLQRIGREVLITVTDKEILKLKTTVIPLKYGVRKNEPLQIKVIHNNQGNISVKPDVQLKITKDDRMVFNVIFPYSEDEKPVRPLERKTMSLIEWQTAGQENGEYKAEVKVLLAGKVIHENDFRFTTGFDINKYLSFVSRVGGGNLVLGWLMAGGFLIILSTLFISISRKKRFLRMRIKRRKT